MATKPQNNQPKNNQPKNNKSKDFKEKNASSLSYNRNVPMLIITAIFLFFMMYSLLRHLRKRDDMLEQKIDTEIRKKLYFTDIY